jgi:CRISPR-associated protein Cas2
VKSKSLYVIVYDIPDDKRRTKTHKLLCGYGAWTQYSLFECWLNPRQLIELRHKLQQIINSNEDNLRFYQLCGNCQTKVETIGSTQPQMPSIFMA